MPADVAVFFDFGGSNETPQTSQNASDLTSGGANPVNLRFKTADDGDIDTNNPIPIPTSGSNYSFWKHVYLKCTGGTFTQINNVKFYTGGSGFGTGITTHVGNSTPTKNSSSSSGYKVATGTVGTTGLEMVENHGGVSSGKTDAFTFVNTNQSTMKSVPISETGSKIVSSGQTTNYLVFQMQVGTTATAGDKPNLTWTFQYDEI